VTLTDVKGGILQISTALKRGIFKICMGIKGPDSIDAWRFKGFDGNRWIEKAGNVRTSKDYRRGWISQTLTATREGIYGKIWL
jgi:hypothetical protein